MLDSLIKMAGPWITDHERSVVAQMMQTGWDSYEYVEKFERDFADWHSRRYCLMTPCCTHAIHLALLALGIGEGDEVILPECTWTATAAPVRYERSTPVFADIDAETWCLDPDSARSRLSPRTKAIITVDLYGNMGAMDKLAAVAEEAGVPLIEDAAEALGSTYRGIRAGKFGVASVHSFHRTKTLTTGEGGALLLDDEEVFARAAFLRDHGRSSEIPYYTLEATPKYMPSNLQGALACAQFDRIDELVRRKREIYHRYVSNLSDIQDLQLNIDSGDVRNGVWATSVVLGESHGLTKRDAMARLAEMGIPARPFFYPLSSLPAYRDLGTGSRAQNPIAYSVSERGITLACHYELRDEQIDRICNGIRAILLG